MAISEATKQAVMDYKSRLKVRLETLNREIAEHQAIITSLTAQKAALTGQVNALQLDIPEPEKVVLP